MHRAVRDEPLLAVDDARVVQAERRIGDRAVVGVAEAELAHAAA